MAPLCFVLMPFGTKTDGNKKEIDFDNVYNNFIKKAIIAAGLLPIRADEEKTGGFIHKPMYERLMYCDFAVADLSFAIANVFYELGIRHALKPFTTATIFEVNTKLPFDTAALRTFPYNYEGGAVADVENKIKELSDLIKINLNAQNAALDSPIAQLITGYKFPNLSGLQQDADAFADSVIGIKKLKDGLNQIANNWKKLNQQKIDATSDDEKHVIETEQDKLVNDIFRIENDEGSSLKFNYDLLYAIISAYKTTNAFARLKMLLQPLVDGAFKENIYIKQQLGLAFNKTKDREEAEKILRTIIDQYGPDPETNGLLGAVYKGWMDDSLKKGKTDIAAEYREQSIDAYVAGFESDPRDYYPGVNALTLMFLGDVDDTRFKQFMPLVTYAVERQLKIKAKDYWVQATALELAVLDMNSAKARKYAAAALTCAFDIWMKQSTADNLKNIYMKALQSRGEDALQWLKAIIVELDNDIFN